VNIFTEFETRISAAIAAVQKSGDLPAELDLTRVSSEPPRDEEHGDVATNAAMVLAKPAGKNPREIARKLADILGEADDVVEVSIAGPGFINIRLADQFWHKVIRAALAKGRAFGASDLGRAEKINVEYVSVNPTGPLHVGHCRGAVFGDALANLLDYAGYDVVREYYFNDAGSQIDALARSVFTGVCAKLWARRWGKCPMACTPVNTSSPWPGNWPIAMVRN